MDFGRMGIRQRQRILSSPTTRIGKFCGVSLFKIIVFLACLAGVMGLCAAAGVYMGVIATAPDITNVDVSPAGFSTTVYDNEGNRITKLVAENSNRVYVTLDKIPVHLQHAFVAIEDERFYQHNGIDIQGIMRAGVTALTSGDLSQGASTITQQLLKNNVFTTWTQENSKLDKFKRKFQEQYCAVQLEKVMDKDTILENYLNTINLGQGTLGVQAAAQRYFGKNAADLTISESACIACITQNPSKWNPISHPENNAIRRGEVLRKMLAQGYITQAEYDDAVADDVYSRIQTVNEQVEKNTIYTYFVDELTAEVIQDLQDVLGYSYLQAYNSLYSGGLSIFTTQDAAIQRICDEEFSNPDNFPENTPLLLDYALTYTDEDGDPVNFSAENFESYFKENRSSSFNMIYSSREDIDADIAAYKAYVEKPGYNFVTESISVTPQPQVSITVMNQSTGEVVALVGGRGTKTASLTLNRATDTKRQPGSCFKVLAAYAPALDSGQYTLASVQIDEPYSYENGRQVKNWYSTGYKGPCTYRYGIEQSLNIIAVKALTAITPRYAFDYLLNFGFTTLVERRTEWNGSISSDITQALALGGLTDGVTNMELTAAYATIANGGTYTKPRLYTKIIDHDGNVLLENNAMTRQVIRPTTAWLLTSAMEDVVSKGTGAKVNFGNMAIAGKTGTTSSNVDVWFSGFTPYYTCAAWAGYDNNIHMGSAETGIAKTLWKAVMGRIHEDLEYKSFTKPSGIVQASVCKYTGMAPTDYCTMSGTVISEYFEEGTVPSEICPGHISESAAYGTMLPGLMCSLTGLRATSACPYATMGVVAVGVPYCEHSTDAPTVTVNPDGTVTNTYSDGTSSLEGASGTTDTTEPTVINPPVQTPDLSALFGQTPIAQ